MNIMRSYLTLFCFLCLATAVARRNPSTPATPAKASPPGSGLDDLDGMRWAYPYGWGLDEAARQVPVTKKDEKEVKPVKRAPKKAMDPGKTGWFGSKADRDKLMEKVEDAMDGFE